ncbi:MAG: toll/interleukin-1 receptor domain-containing protein [Deltaproteobacteria bacterium]|nr:toll/interleukin-1 receptor domain-containing protein [Deltaproteobacteria bacterium]
MKVFISWSGDRSRAVADVLRRWFPSVLQAVRPYFSPDDVAKGSRWSSEIAKELEGSRVGLLVITPENQEAPWLLFEAGALAKNLDRSKVCPLLFGGMEPTDVKGPLVQFQAAQFSKDEMKRVIKMMNGDLAESALLPDVLDSVFEMWWPKLEEQVARELEGSDESDDEARRSERDLLEEVLALTRRLASDRERRHEFDHPAWDELLMSVVELARVTRARTPDDETIAAIRRLMRPLEYIAHREMRRGPGRIGRHARHLMMELEELLTSDLKVKPAPEPEADESSS